MSTDDVKTIEPLSGPLSGSCVVPGDKSISHRAVLFSAMAEGASRLSGVLDSSDVRARKAARRQSVGRRGRVGRERPQAA